MTKLRDPNIQTNGTLPQSDMAPMSGHSSQPEQQRRAIPNQKPDETEAEHNAGSYAQNNPDGPGERDEPTPRETVSTLIGDDDGVNRTASAGRAETGRTRSQSR